MYRKPGKQRLLIRRILTYAIMTLSIVLIATFIVFFVMGFRFNADDGRIEQYAFLQYASSPSRAAVAIDDISIGSSTPTKNSTRAGSHKITMTLQGYKTWEKTMILKPGIMTWLDYTLMVPQELTTSSVASFKTIYSSLASPKGTSILIQEKSDTPTFNLMDLTSDSVKKTSVIVPASSYSKAGVKGIKHVFDVTKWDEGGRYVLIKHTYGDTVEWLSLDTQNASQTLNITSLFNITISSIDFIGTGGNKYYVLSSSDVRKLDLLSSTITKPLISNVKSFSIYDSTAITYVGTDTLTGNQVVGLYRDGESQPHVLRSVTDKKAVVGVATTQYFNEDYLAISVNKNVDILSGSYPNKPSDDAISMKIIASFTVKNDIQNLSFSPTGEYVLAQTGADFASYDLEYQTVAQSTIEGVGSTAGLKWLDDNYVWSSRDGNLTIREFDGANKHTITKAITDQDVVMTINGKYIYSINLVGGSYQLQRTLMILP
ncbi:MAG: PEGA domain-containing protein [Candidatus Saccharimonadales bacterium]